MERTRRFFLKDFARFSGAVLFSAEKQSRVLPTPTPTPSPMELTVTPTPTPTPEPEADESIKPACKLVPGMNWIGKASYYSETGCGGCSPSRIMANGQRFNENAYTVAFMRLPLNTSVLVTNLSTNLTVEALVTDRGGFERHGRIVDVSLVVARAIKLQTDTSIIQISKIECE